MNKEKLSDWIYKNCKWRVSLRYTESFISINIPLSNPDLDTLHGKKYHLDDNTKHYHWYFPRIGSWAYAEKRIFNDLQKGIIKIERVA